MYVYITANLFLIGILIEVKVCGAIQIIFIIWIMITMLNEDFSKYQSNTCMNNKFFGFLNVLNEKWHEKCGWAVVVDVGGGC